MVEIGEKIKRVFFRERNMLRYLVIMIFVFSTFVVEAYEVPTNFLKKWAATPTKGTAQNGRVKIFQRFTSAGGHVYSIGSITFMQFPAKDKLSYDDIVG